jgi:anhydro-N-acetylmuramic acid kinase
MSLTLAGVMTGTSCDALDATAVRFGPRGFTQVWSRSAAYPRDLRHRVLSLQRPGARVQLKELLCLHRDLGDWYGRTLRRWCGRGIDAIANHGQTVAHFPPVSTLQLGEAAAIAHHTGITVISDFRWGDLVGGGQGAPLAPSFHHELYARAARAGASIAIHNLGGISNLTYLRPNAAPLAWDTGPANLWMDAIVRSRTRSKLQFDRGGRLAKKGKVHFQLRERLLANPYFGRKPPKSTGRDEFPESEVIRLTQRLSTKDAIATACSATARSIAMDYFNHILSRGLPLERIFFCGGGAVNPTLLELVHLELLSLGWHVEVDTTDALGIDPQSMEACAFAFLGNRALRGETLGGAWTGGSSDSPGAKLTPGRNWASLLRKLRAL